MPNQTNRYLSVSALALIMLLNFACKKQQAAADRLFPDQKVTVINSVPTPEAMPEASLTANGGTVIGNGVNIQPSYFCGGDQDLGWKLMITYPKIKTVRIEIDPAAQATMPDYVRWISEANANGMQAIVTYHKSTDNGSPDPSKLMNAANWWKTNYDALSAGGPFVVNLMNEWGDHSVTASQYSSAYNSAISVVRQVYNGTIICDLPGWGQEFHIAADASSSITDTNLIFSAHIYPVAWESFYSGPPIKASIDYLHNTGRKCIIGEFGSGGRGSTDWSGLVDYAKSKNWAVIGWAWNGDGSKPTKMNMASPYWGDKNGCKATTYSASSYFNTIYNKL